MSDVPILLIYTMAIRLSSIIKMKKTIIYPPVWSAEFSTEFSYRLVFVCVVAKFFHVNIRRAYSTLLRYDYQLFTSLGFLKNEKNNNISNISNRVAADL